MLVARPRPLPRPLPLSAAPRSVRPASLHFKAAPIKVSDEEVIPVASAEGKPIYAAELWNPAVGRGLGWTLISYNTMELDKLKALANEGDFESLRDKLKFINLGGSEGVLKIITNKVAELTGTVAELRAELDGMKELMFTGSSPSILVYECMRLLACRVAKEYNHEYKKLGEAEVELWKRAFSKYSDKISFKVWERAFSKYSTNHTPRSNVSFEVAMSALYHCLARPRELKVNVKEYPFLCEKMVPMYRAAVGRYCEKLGEEKGEFVRKLLAPDSDAELMRVLKEWNRLKSGREGRNKMDLVACLVDDNYSEAEPELHFAGLVHCDYCKSELGRVEVVRKVLARYVGSNSEYVDGFTVLCKAALVELNNSMEKRQEAVAVAAAMYKLRAAAAAEIWGPLFGDV